MKIRAFETEESIRTAIDVWAQTMAGPSMQLDERQGEFIATMAQIHDYDLGQHQFTPVDLNDVVALITAPEMKMVLVQMTGIAALVNRPVTRESAEFLEALAKKLAIKESIVAVVRAVAEGKKRKARLLTFRRMMKNVIGEAYESEGIWGPVRFLSALFFGQTVNRGLAQTFHRFGLLPDGTLGREYWRHLVELGFNFPGEPKGIPMSIAYHDVGHVLTGYDTTPAGEIQQGAFQAGCRKRDGFAFLQFVVLQFHQGIKITPVAPPEVDCFKPRHVLGAVYRGSQCKVDITHQWDFFPEMSKPIETVRREFLIG